MREMGVPAPRTSFTELYVNGDLWGVYQLVEQVDKEFLDLNYASDKGNLYKNLGWSKFENLGTAPGPYQDIFGLKTNEDENDWTGFIDFVQFLNSSSDTEFEADIESIFNVDQFLRVLAVDVSLNNWDSYLEHGRNYYIYEDKASGVFNWIPWGYNFSIPGGPGGGLGGGPSNYCFAFIYGAGLTDGSTTVEFGQVTSTNADSVSYRWTFGDGNSSTESNPTHTYDTPGTYSVLVEVSGNVGECTDFDYIQITTTDSTLVCDAVDGAPGSPTAGIPFLLTLRFEPQCCDEWGNYCADAYSFFGGGPTGGGGGGGGFGDTDFLIDQRQNDGILISRLLNVPKYYEAYQAYMCSLLGGSLDSVALLQYIETNEALLTPVVERDPNFPGGISAFEATMGEAGIKHILAEREAALEIQLDTVANCSPALSIQFQEIVINEVAASMDSLSQVADGVGQYDDWVELYNPSSNPVDLSGAYLSDSRDQPTKWSFPYGSIIEAEGYLIAWADKGLGQPGVHTSFRLKRG